jgi:hypothetical protein
MKVKLRCSLPIAISLPARPSVGEVPARPADDAGCCRRITGSEKFTSLPREGTAGASATVGLLIIEVFAGLALSGEVAPG